MSDIRQGLLGLLFALLTGLVIFGGAVLSLVESNYLEEKSASATYLAAWDMSGIKPYTPVAGGATFTAVPVGRETLTPTPTFGPVPGCKIPEGWVSIMTQFGDTLDDIASRYRISVTELVSANCLASDQLELTQGIFLFVPLPTPTQIPSATFRVEVTATTVKQATQYVCGVPYGWVAYRVRSGDTLYSLSRLTGVSVYQIQVANCLGNSTFIVTGQILYLPFIPVFPSSTPAPTWTSGPQSQTPTILSTPSATATIPFTATSTWTDVPPTETETPGPVTPSLSPTVTIQATDTITPTSVPPTATPQPSATELPPTKTQISTITATSILPTLTYTPSVDPNS